jgi:hypothetical protein
MKGKKKNIFIDVWEKNYSRMDSRDLESTIF